MDSPNATVRNPRVVVTGASFGGLSAAKRLANSRCRIILIDRSAQLPPILTVAVHKEGCFPTQNPELS